jgi:hypothetical protein
MKVYEVGIVSSKRIGLQQFVCVNFAPEVVIRPLRQYLAPRSTFIPQKNRIIINNSITGTVAD